MKQLHTKQTQKYFVIRGKSGWALFRWIVAALVFWTLLHTLQEAEHNLLLQKPIQQKASNKQTKASVSHDGTLEF